MVNGVDRHLETKVRITGKKLRRDFLRFQTFSSKGCRISFQNRLWKNGKFRVKATILRNINHTKEAIEYSSTAFVAPTNCRLFSIWLPTFGYLNTRRLSLKWFFSMLFRYRLYECRLFVYFPFFSFFLHFLLMPLFAILFNIFVLMDFIQLFLKFC